MCHLFPCIVLHSLIRYSSDSVVSLFALEVSSRIPYLPHTIYSTMCSTVFVVICDARPRPRLVVARISGHLADPTGPPISVTNIKMRYSGDSVVSLSPWRLPPEHIIYYTLYMCACHVAVSSQLGLFPLLGIDRATSSTKSCQTPRRKSGTMASVPLCCRHILACMQCNRIQWGLSREA